MRLRHGDKGEAVKSVQLDLMNLGYDLPKYGPDGSAGDEMFNALEDFARDRGIDLGPNEKLDSGVESDRVADEVVKAAKVRRSETHVPLGKGTDLRNVHRGDYRKGLRSIDVVDTIVLHQTAYIYPNPALWRTLRAHIGVPRPSGAGWLLVNPLEQKMWHANSLNTRSIGLEIEGNMYGIEGDKRTFWTPPASVPADRRGPHTITDEQIASSRDAIRFSVLRIQELGGQIKFMNAHRQSSRDRIGDPGSKVWHEVALWAIKEYDLSDGGPGKVFCDGRPLPDEWTKEPRGVSYF